MIKKYIFWLLFLLSSSTYAQEIILSDEADEVVVGYNCLVFEDANKQFSELDILNSNFQKNFQKTTLSIPNFGYGTSNIWLKINLKNTSTKHWFLEIDNPRINHLSAFVGVFANKSGGNFVGENTNKGENNQIIYKTQTGDYQPFSSYQIADRNHFFDLKMLQNESYTIYLKANSSEDLKFPITFWEERKLYQHLANRNLIWGIYFGFIFLISLYNFFLWLIIRDKSYIFYTLYVLTFGLMQACIYGYGFQYIWSNSFINDRGVVVFMFGSNFFMIHFLRNFLNLKKNLPSWHQISTKMAWGTFILILISLFFYQWYFNIVGVFLVLILISIFFFLIIKLVLKKLKSAYFSLFAFSALMFASIFVVFKNLGIISAENQDYYLMIGSMIEIVLFSLALGDKFRQEQLEKERQQYIRNEIAANLHDDLAASLSSLTMFSESNRRKAQKESNSNELIFSKISDKSREILNLVRENVWEMNPRNDQSEEWLDRIIKFATDTLESKQIELHLNVSDEVRNMILPIDFRRDLYLFVKEAINNIAKHSEADLVEMSLYLQQNILFLNIKDDGKGFDTKEFSNGNGLLNFQNRAKNLKGKCEINSIIGEGTEVRLWFKFSY
jgi:signal transduction histidine kinase